MPLLKHAKKKQRQDKKRTIKNAKLEKLFKSLVKKAKVERTVETVAAAYKQIDKAAKHNIIHENKAARLKSSIAKTNEAGAAAAAPKKSIAKQNAKKTTGKKNTPKTKKK